MRSHAAPVGLAQRVLSAIRGAGHRSDHEKKRSAGARSSTESASCANAAAPRPPKRRLSWDKLWPLTPSKLSKGWAGSSHRHGSNTSVSTTDSAISTASSGSTAAAVRPRTPKKLQIDGGASAAKLRFRNANPAIRRCMDAMALERPRSLPVDIGQHVPEAELSASQLSVATTDSAATVAETSCTETDAIVPTSAAAAVTAQAPGWRTRRGVRFSSDPDIIIAYEAAADSDSDTEDNSKRKTAGRARRRVHKHKNVHASFIKAVPQEHQDLSNVFDMIDTYVVSHERSASA